MSSSRLRIGRHSQPLAWYAVTTVTARRLPLFTTAAVAGIVHEEIHTCERTGLLSSDAWVLMPDHLHWLFQLQEQHSLSRCLQVFKSRSSRALRQHLGGNGSVWQSGYYDHRLRHDEDRLAQARYIVANPLRAGLVQCIEDYPYWWSRHITSRADL